MFCDNEAVYKNYSTTESVLRKKYHRIAYCMFFAKEGTETNLADIYTKMCQGPEDSSFQTCSPTEGSMKKIWRTQLCYSQDYSCVINS